MKLKMIFPIVLFSFLFIGQNNDLENQYFEFPKANLKTQNMLINVELSAILSSKNTSYDLPILLWKIFRLKDGKQVKDKPDLRDFGAVVKGKLKKGDYVVTYQVGAIAGEFYMSLGDNDTFKKQIDLNAGVIEILVVPEKDKKPHPDGLIWCNQKKKK